MLQIENDTTYYIMLLEALESLFHNTNNSWERWIKKDISNFEESGDVVHHLRAYGELGSINQVEITCEDNSLPPGSILWINQLLKEMLRLTYNIAGKIEANEEIKKTDIMAMISSHNYIITGEKCLNCRYGKVSIDKINSFLSRQMVPALLKEYMEKNELTNLVERFLSFRVPGLAKAEHNIRRALQSRNLHIDFQKKEMLSCPRCKSKEVNLIDYRVIKINMIYADRYILTPTYVNI